MRPFFRRRLRRLQQPNRGFIDEVMGRHRNRPALAPEKKRRDGGKFAIDSLVEARTRGLIALPARRQQRHDLLWRSNGRSPLTRYGPDLKHKIGGE